MTKIYRGRRLALYVVLAILMPRWWATAPIVL
ncbi:Uncharacterised protein [Raoultella terrigena]|uniref:Uncharacterized protein n=1 Tax=Raoultella terrigena TaxID=577 RepID=A0A4V6J2P7_RAOTE|nr:Uncharacterised protein [Raoultella terrigena]